MTTILPSPKDDISSTVSSNLNVQRASHDFRRWQQDLISDMSKTPAEKEAQAAQRVSLWKERILGKQFIEHWWQRSGQSVRLNQCTPDPCRSDADDFHFLMDEDLQGH